MPRNDDVRFTSCSIKLPPLGHNSSITFFSKLQFTSQFLINSLMKPQKPLNFNFNLKKKSITNFFTNFPKPPNLLSSFRFHPPLKSSLLCSASLALSDGGNAESDLSGSTNQTVLKSPSQTQITSRDEERVLISEVWVRNKDGDELERKDLESEAKNALKASRPNSALTVRDVQEDVHRIIASGYFASCMPVAVDTRDGIRLVFQVEPNQEFQGLVCEGANVLPSKFIEDAFRDGYGKVVNIRRLDDVINSINGWYMERGLFGMVYSMLQGKRDVDTLLTMGIMEDVSIIPQPAGDSNKIDLTLNIVERKSGGGISAGGGISSGITSGPLAGLIGSCAIYHKNLFGKNQKLNVSLERGQIDSIFRINYTDPWIEGDDTRTSRSIMIQNSRTPGTLVHGNQPDSNSFTIGRVTAGIEYSRPFRPKWNGTLGLIFQRAGAHDDKGNPVIRDFYSSPLTASGNTHDDMLLAKLETVYTGSGDPGSSMFAFNMDQGIPVWPEWLVFNRVNARARKGLVLGPACLRLSLSGGHVVGNFPPHEAFAIGGTNSVRGYEEGAVGSGRSCAIGCGEVSFPLTGPVEGVIFADYGTDLGSGSIVPGDPAGARLKPGSGYGYGLGIRVDSPLGPLRLEYAFNDQRTGRFHFGVGLRN
ncbi:outer envelope protein 80, chloroplastic-like isoform X2 [Coffea arabica]|uniref:Outer envelope protein 80, chloroplastic-like isoform X2 n=1 Tax=Coffea arabica TaxID=13443 RepID=A0ABM4V4I2_COFAR